MGRDKALVELCRMPLINWARLILNAAGLEVWIAGARNPELASFAPVIADAWDNAGPLGGVCSALRQTDRDWAVFVTIDQPLMAPEFIVSLLEHARSGEGAVTVASVGGVPQTFPAVVQRSARAVLEGKLEQEQLRCMGAFRGAGLQVIGAEDIVVPESRSLLDLWFSNVNTPEDLEKLESVLKAPSRNLNLKQWLI
jgi:molybdopterin-guanine dinucleotide biosynthesis protein A